MTTGNFPLQLAMAGGKETKRMSRCASLSRAAPAPYPTCRSPLLECPSTARAVAGISGNRHRRRHFDSPRQGTEGANGKCHDEALTNPNRFFWFVSSFCHQSTTATANTWTPAAVSNAGPPPTDPLALLSLFPHLAQPLAPRNASEPNGRAAHPPWL